MSVEILLFSNVNRDAGFYQTGRVKNSARLNPDEFAISE